MSTITLTPEQLATIIADAVAKGVATALAAQPARSANAERCARYRESKRVKTMSKACHDMSTTCAPSPALPLLPPSPSSPTPPSVSPPIIPLSPPPPLSLPPGGGVTSRKPKKEAEPPKPADPRHRAFIQTFCDSFETEMGVKYAFTGRDAKALSDLLKLTPMDVEDLAALLRWAWHEAGTNVFAPKCCKDARTLHGFCASFNAIGGARSARPRHQPKHAAYRASEATRGLTPDEISNF